MIGRPTPTDLGPNPQALLDAGRTAWSNGYRDDAVRRWRCASAAAPGLVAPYMNLTGVGLEKSWVEKAATTLAHGDPAVFKNLGVLALQRGEPERARRCFQRALVLSPDRPATVDTFARSLAAASSDRDRVSWTRRVTILLPADERPWSDLLKGLIQAGSLDEAVARTEAIPLPPRDWSAGFLELVSELYTRNGRYDRALALVDLLAERQPADPTPRILRAVLLRRTGESSRAVVDAKRAVLLDPASFDALGSAGTELCHANEHSQAARVFEHALIVEPGRREGVIENYALSLKFLDRGELGMRLQREAAIRHPGRAKAYINLSTAMMGEQDVDRAVQLARRATIVDDGIAEAHYQLGFALRHQGATAEARAAFRRAIGFGTGNPQYRFAEALHELADGDPAVGINLYEARWRVPNFPSYRSENSGRTLPQPMWIGDIRPDATLAIWGEQGIGDEIWFAGYLDWASTRVGRILLEITPHLAGLMARTFPTIEVLRRGDPGTEASMAAADLQIPMGSLLRLSGRMAAPVPTGFLAVDGDRVTRLRERYSGGRSDVRLLGLSWRSVKPNLALSFEAPLEAWEPILSLPGTVFVSLQYGEVQDEVRRLAEQVGVPIVVDPGIDAKRDLDAFAAQVAATDAVVTIANSTIAMAHALGKPMHVLLKTVQEDWRFARHQKKTRWLPTARCVWQETPGDWSAPIAEIADSLRSRPG
ncbi:MAG: tetratricopeptide repeat protein [Thalassobaculum sp.]